MAESIAVPGQTIGPFFHALVHPGHSQLVRNGDARAIQLHGVVYDGAGQLVPDALVELWQTDPDGNIVQQPGSLPRRDDVFTGWGRSATDTDGRYRFTTLTPGAPAGRSPFFVLAIFARGLLHRLFTRAYLPGAVVADDPLLRTLDGARRETLGCIREPTGYRFDIHLQGPRETVFLDYRSSPR